MPLTASAVIGGLGAVSKIISGAKQQQEARELQRRNVRPTFNIEDEYYQNRDLAASQATQGLSADAKEYQRTMAERGLSSSIGAMLQAGGGTSSLSDVYDAYNRSALQGAVADTQMKAENLKTYMAANNQLAGQKTQKWVLDKYEPYKDTARAAAAELAAGQTNVQTGISEAAATAAAYSQAQNYNDMLETQKQAMLNSTRQWNPNALVNPTMNVPIPELPKYKAPPMDAATYYSRSEERIPPPKLATNIFLKR